MTAPDSDGLEAARLATIDDLGLMQPTSIEAYERIARLTRQALGLPICLFSVLGSDVQFFRACDGLETRETPIEHSFCRVAVDQGDLLVVEDARADPRFADNPLVTGPPHIRFYAGLPVLAPNRIPVGAICGIDRKPGTLSAAQRASLEDGRAVLEDAMYLTWTSNRDFLTGLANRRFFDEQMGREWRRAYRHLLPMSVLLIDLDYFKPYNDANGHPAGDEALRRLARAIAGQARRAGDFVARFGGEEFVVVLPETSAEGAATIAERIREAIADAAIAHPQSPFGVLTASIGGATAPDNQSLHHGHPRLLELADEQLYAAKQGGRNRVVAAGE